MTLLRGFGLAVDELQPRLIWSAQRVLAFLALKDRPLQRSFLADALWPEASTQQAAANLRSALWRIHKVSRHLVEASRQSLTVGRTVEVDLRDVQDRARRLLDRDRDCVDILTSGTRFDLSLDLLAEWFDTDWVVFEREHHRQLRLHALEAMCERLTADRRYGAAVEAGLEAVRADPLRESAHHVLICAHLAEGNRGEALRQFQMCRRQLLVELGLEPSAMLTALLPQFARSPA